MVDEAFRAKERARVARWRITHPDPEKLRALGRARAARWRAAHPEYLAAQRKRLRAWRAANPESSRDHTAKYAKTPLGQLSIAIKQIRHRKRQNLQKLAALTHEETQWKS